MSPNDIIALYDEQRTILPKNYYSVVRVIFPKDVFMLIERIVIKKTTIENKIAINT